MSKAKSYSHIIVRMPNWIGDAVMATPLLKDLRSYYPDAEITLMCQGAIGRLFENDPHVDQILSFKKSSGWLHRRHKDVINPLRFGEYDLGILTTNSFSSAWWFWRGRVRERIGFSTCFRSLFLSKALPFPEERETMHLVDLYRQLLTPLGIAPTDTKMYLEVTEEEIRKCKRFLQTFHVQVGTDTVVAINPGAAYGTAKCWLPERFTALAKRLSEEAGAKVLFLGDASQAPLIRSIMDGLGENVINLAGKTNLRELMALLRVSRLLVTNDSGPMHIASALQTPLVALFGSTSHAKTGPYNGGTVLYKKVPCSPCYKRICPIDFPCMKNITTDEVYAASLKELNLAPCPL